MVLSSSCDVWPILVFSSYILEGCLMLHLLKFHWKSGLHWLIFGGSTAGWLVSVVLLDGSLGSLCSVVLQDGWPKLSCVH